MSVGTVSIDGVQVATVESFEFTPKVEAPVDWITGPVLPAGMYRAVTIPFAVPEVTHVRQVPKGRWVRWGNRRVAYKVRGIVVGIVAGSQAECASLSGGIISFKARRRRCESKRWVEKTYAEAWYREEMWFQRLRAMGWKTTADMKAEGEND